MKQVMGLAVIGGAVALAVVIGQRMSSDAMAVALGVVFGVGASIPASVLVIVAVRGRRGEGVRRSDVVQQPAAPQIYIVAPGQSGPMWGGQLVRGGEPMRGGEPAVGYPMGESRRRYKVVGEEERWLEATPWD